MPGPLSISIEGRYIHAGLDADGSSEEVRVPAKSSRLMQLTNHLVTEAARLDASQMRLVFDHGHSLYGVSMDGHGASKAIWRRLPGSVEVAA